MSSAFAVLLAVYVGGTTAYSLLLKRFAYVDVIALAGLYVLRIELGALAIAVPASRWLVAFSIAAFLSLAALKRSIEIGEAMRAGHAAALRRSYRGDHGSAILRLGIGSAGVAVIVLALYTLSREAATYYRYPAALWSIVVLAAFWLARAWQLARDGAIVGDPVAFALRDGVSYAVLLATGAALWAGV